jgi:PIN domain nuclease of toxin-antitoxin system
LKVLLDTHVLFWWLTADANLSERAKRILSDPTTTVYVSAASAWEIATEVRIGKWPEAADLAGNLVTVLAEEGFEPLAITLEHAESAGFLHGDHKDPFDRILAAQALPDGLPLVTSDAELDQFAVRTLW